MSGIIDNELELEDMLKDRYLTFSIGQEIYGVEVRYVIEIVGIKTIAEITEIPELPEYVKGIINLRGKIIPVLDLRLRFRKEPKDYDDRTCVIVIDIMGKYVGLIVDSVAEVTTIPEEEVDEPPRLSKGFSNKCVKKIGKVGSEVRLLLDCEMLLSEDDIVEIGSF